MSIIWEEGKTTRDVWLPAGETWSDAWDNGKEYEGGQYISVESPAYHTPVFIKKGSKVDLGNLDSIWEKSLEMASRPFNLSALESRENW